MPWQLDHSCYLLSAPTRGNISSTVFGVVARFFYRLLYFEFFLFVPLYFVEEIRTMGMPLKEALRRLCVEIGWSYAVFWKAIGFSQRIHLVWEDSCYSDKQFASTLPLDSLLREQGVVHAIGEGIIGQAALSGMHLWINRDALLNNENKSFTELNQQFSAGIQTIVVIPVLPHGVLQLGSTCTVLENIPFLVLVKSLFSQLQSRPIVSVPDSTQTNHIHSLNSVGMPISCTPSVQSNSFEHASNLPKEETLQCGSDLFDMFGTSKVNESRSNFDNIGQNCMQNMQTFDLVEGQASQSAIFSDSGTDQLLDAVVSNINIHAKESSISTGTSTGNVSCDTTLTNAQASSSHSAQKSQLQLWIEGGSGSRSEGLQTDTVGTSGTGADMAVRSTNKKRCRPGENPRPRPKDRQLIQDRIKELRELVPNGSKCSIDALLEKTVKHMLFLQSVTKHANKLKESGRPKLQEQQLVSEGGGVILKDDFEGGATWAFEMGPQSMSCPIIVEDLDPPHQLLIEMVCEDRGLFLEIADLVRGLGLTILKGVMEYRKNKIWARFSVEATREVTRMEIFLSLVHLLKPNGNNSDGPAGTISNNANVLNQTGVVIPTTAVPDDLR